jgi:hypothetical protein
LGVWKSRRGISNVVLLQNSITKRIRNFGQSSHQILTSRFQSKLLCGRRYYVLSELGHY